MKHLRHVWRLYDLGAPPQPSQSRENCCHQKRMADWGDTRVLELILCSVGLNANIKTVISVEAGSWEMLIHKDE